MLPNTLNKVLNILQEDKYPVRRLMAATIGRSGLGKWFKLKIAIQDYQIFFHPTGLCSLYWYNSRARSDDFTFITSFLKEGDTYIDVGANIGVTVIPAAKSIGMKGTCKAFEPHPKICSYLKENLKLNGLKNVEVYNLALGDLEKDIYLTDNFTDEVNCVIEAPDLVKSIKVSMTTLDLATEDLESIDLLKIDVEGYEKFVLEGAKQALKKVGCIYFEVTEKNFVELGYSTPDILRLLDDEGFEIYRRNGEDNELLKVNSSYTSSKSLYENLIALKNVQDFESRTGWQIS
jgi:FkbM family methyltransferase